MSKTVLLRVTALAVLCLAFTAPSGVLGSCVQFSTQTVRVHVDAENDRLDLQLIYRDLHATGGGTHGAMEQLEQLSDGARWIALFSNWPFMLNLDRVLDDPPEEGDFGSELIVALAQDLEVRPSELWVNDAGELCGSQLVRLENLDHFVGLVDAWLREVVVGSPGFLPVNLSLHGIHDPRSVDLLLERARRGEALFVRRGASFVLRLPITDLGARQFFMEVLRATNQEHGDELAALPRPLQESKESETTPPSDPSATSDDASELALLLQLLAANDWSVARRRGALEFTFGDPDADIWVLETPVGVRLHEQTRAELRPVLREAGWEILGPEHEAALAARWQAFLEER